MNIKAENLLTAALLASTTVQATPTDLMKTQHTQAHKIIQNHLVDPDSARFADDSYVVQEYFNTICGLVNARNRMGGYAGNQLYYVVFDRAGKPIESDIVPQFSRYDRPDVIQDKTVIYDRWKDACKNGKTEESLGE